MTTKLLTPEELEGRTLQELRSIVTDYGASWHHAEREKKLISRICELSCIVQPHEKDSRLREKAADAAPPAPKVAAEVLTDEQILEALAPQIEAGLEVAFPSDDSWAFSFRGRSDSGNRKIPVRTLQRCASVMMSASVPKCQSCGELMAFDSETKSFMCKNPKCKKASKPANPEKVAA